MPSALKLPEQCSKGLVGESFKGGTFARRLPMPGCGRQRVLTPLVPVVVRARHAEQEAAYNTEMLTESSRCSKPLATGAWF